MSSVLSCEYYASGMTRAWILAWTFVALAFAGFWMYGLFDLDEGIYAAATAEMMSRGDWIIATYNGAPFLEKPILIYWAALGFLKLGVPGEVALRLPAALATLGTLLVVAGFTRRRFGDREALWSVLILAASPLFMGVGRMFMPDALLVLFMTAAYLAFWESLEGSPRWLWLGGAMLGLAVLAKGPMPAVVFLLLLIYAGLRLPKAQVRRGRILGWAVGFVAFAAVVASWYVPVMLARGPEFMSEFLLRQNIGRLAGADEAHLGPFWLYVPVVLLGLAPFTFGLAGAWRRVRAFPVERFLWAWALLVFLLFSVAGSKLPHYVLPALPPLAILLARYGVQARWNLSYAGWAYGGLLGVAAIVYSDRLGQPLSGALIALGIAALAGTLWSFFIRKGKERWLRQGFAVAAPITLAAMVVGVPAYWEWSHGPVRRIAGLALASGGRLLEYRTGGFGESGATSHPSISWYVGEATIKTDFLDELVLQAQPGDLVLTRRDRLSPVARRSLPRELDLIKVDAEYQLYRVN